MPYIDKKQRDFIYTDLAPLIDLLQAKSINNENIDGVLNYVISEIVSQVIDSSGTWRYKDIARAIAVFECAKLEFYRRVAIPKENNAITINGDIQGYTIADELRKKEKAKITKETEIDSIKVACERAAKEVEKWPEWKRRIVQQAIDISDFDDSYLEAPG